MEPFGVVSVLDLGGRVLDWVLLLDELDDPPAVDYGLAEQPSQVLPCPCRPHVCPWIPHGRKFG